MSDTTVTINNLDAIGVKYNIVEVRYIDGEIVIDIELA